VLDDSSYHAFEHSSPPRMREASTSELLERWEEHNIAQVLGGRTVVSRDLRGVACEDLREFGIRGQAAAHQLLLRCVSAMFFSSTDDVTATLIVSPRATSWRWVSNIDDDLAGA